MKKILYIILGIILFTLFSINVNAASVILSVSSSNVYVGDSFTVSVNANNIASWSIHVSASGPVSDCIINQADVTSDAKNTNKTFTASCKVTGEGIINLSLSGDITSEEGNTISLSDSKTVTASNRPVNTGGSQTQNPNPSVSNKSTNNKLKKIEIEGHSLEKVDNNNYKLTVSNSVENINIKVEAEDVKATVVGSGNKKLNIGENKIEVQIISESGLQNKINLVIIRKDGYYIEDLDEVLKMADDNISIIIDDKTLISKEKLEKIKVSKRSVNVDYFDKDKNLLYSWKLDGSKMNDLIDVNTSILFTSSIKQKMDKALNYADGVYVNFSHSGLLPSGTKIKIYVGNKYVDNDLVNIYYYDEKDNKIDEVYNNIKVSNGYVEFEIEHCSDYFISKSIISSSTVKINKENNNNFLILLIVSIIEFLIIIVLIIIVGKKVVTTNNINDNNINDNNINDNNINNNIIDNNILKSDTVSINKVNTLDNNITENTYNSNIEN